jgi:hypothetical protein
MHSNATHEQALKKTHTQLKTNALNDGIAKEYLPYLERETRSQSGRIRKVDANYGARCVFRKQD